MNIHEIKRSFRSDRTNDIETENIEAKIINCSFNVTVLNSFVSLYKKLSIMDNFFAQIKIKFNLFFYSFTQYLLSFIHYLIKIVLLIIIQNNPSFITLIRYLKIVYSLFQYF